MALQTTNLIMKGMLSDTILALCRNTLPYEGQFTVEGLLGITLDNKEIFLVNINETIQREGVKHSSKKRNREDVSDKNSDESSSTPESDTDSQEPSGSKRKRRKKKKQNKDRDNDKPSLDISEQSDDADSCGNIQKNIQDQSNVQSTVKDIAERLEDSGENVKQEVNVDDADSDAEDDIMFVKEEVKDTSYEQSYSESGFDAGASETQFDPALEQLQDMTLQLTGQAFSPGQPTLVSI